MAVEVFIDPTKPEHYDTFLAIKRLPRYRFQGHVAYVPDEYAHLISAEAVPAPSGEYTPEPFLFDYQRDITRLAIRKQKFACFVGCGLGKTPIFLSYARHVLSKLPAGKKILIVSPLMVVRQTLAEASRWFGDSLPIEQVRAAGLVEWMTNPAGCRIGITNYEALNQDLPERNRLGCLIIDESSSLKSHYGTWGQKLINLGKGLDWKLCLTGTPAPNDRIEYANHAVILDQFPTVNAFLARYFVNRGQTDNRWEIKPHAVGPFYKDLSHWCIFLECPSTYGWKDNVNNIPPIHTHSHEVDLTGEQRERLVSTGGLFGQLADTPGGITQRGKLAGLAKGRWGKEKVASNKVAAIRSLVDSWIDEESTIIWCRYNSEQDDLEAAFPEAASIRGTTPHEQREKMVEDFQSGKTRVIVSKAECMGFGLNLQIATRQVFNGLWDSYEDFHQCVKRSNRVGSTKPLNVHIVFTEIEQAMVATVFRKLARVEADTLEQEKIFKENGYGSF